MKPKRFIIFTALILLLITALLSFNYKLDEDTNYVPDAETAMRVAEALWDPIYGAEKIDGEKPFKAELKDGVWIVQGTLEEGYRGGCAYIEIRQSDCQVLKLTHYK